MSESIKTPRLLERVQAELRNLLSLLESTDDGPEERPDRRPPESREESIGTRFPIPSRDLAFRLVNVAREDWKNETGRPVEEVLTEVTTDLRKDLVATLADLAFTAIERGDSEVELSTSGRFSEDFVRELMRVLPIDPYVAPEVLDRLHAELLGFARSGGLVASWGHLVEKDGDLEIELPRRSESRSSAAVNTG